MVLDTDHSGRNALHKIRERTSNSSGLAVRNEAGTRFKGLAAGSPTRSDMAVVSFGGDLRRLECSIFFRHGPETTMRCCDGVWEIKRDGVEYIIKCRDGVFSERSYFSGSLMT